MSWSRPRSSWRRRQRLAAADGGLRRGSLGEPELDVRQLVGEGIVHAFSHEMAVEPGGRTACGIAFRPYQLTYEDASSALRFWHRVTNRPDGPHMLHERERAEDVDIDCMACLVAMQIWEP